MGDFVTERDLIGDLEEIILDCGFTDVEIPTEGPGSTYVVMIVPHDEQVIYEEDDVEDGERLGYRGWGLDGSCSVRVYAVPDTEVSPERRQVLAGANGADLSRYELGEVDDRDAAEAALLVESWVSKGDW